MKYLLIAFFFIILHCDSHAQNSLDSLWAIWTNSVQPDTSRCNAMNLLINEIIRNDPDSANVLATALLDLATEKNLKKYQADAMLHQSRSFGFQFINPQAVIDLANKSFALYQELDDNRGAAHALSNIGDTYTKRGEYLLALEYLHRSLSFAEKSGSKYHISNILYIIAEAYVAIDADDKALPYLEKGLRVAEEGNLKREISFSLKEIGRLYIKQGNYRLAHVYNEKSLSLAMETGVKREIAEVFLNIGMVNIQLGEYNVALENFERSLTLQQEIGNFSDVAFILIQIGFANIENKNYRQASEYFDKALSITEQVDARLHYPTIYNSRGIINQYLGNFNQAIVWCQKGLRYAKELNKILEEKNACECLYRAHKSLNQGNKALLYHEQLLMIKDSILADETDKKLLQMEFSKQMAVDSLQNEEDRLKAEMQAQEEINKEKSIKNQLQAGGSVLLVLAFGLFSRLRFIRKSKATLQIEKDRSESLLLNILPAEVAEELKLNGEAVAKDFDRVSIIFTDFKGFTESSEKVSAAELVGELNHCFKGFDAIMEKHGIEKIKTIGDAYMAAGGLPVATDDSIQNTVKAALEMQQFMTARKVEQDARGLLSFQMRAGIHTGPVVAGIVGVKKFQYDIWGDTVNTASRMESNGEVDQVNISQDTYEHIKNNPDFTFRKRGKIQAKGKGEMEMYFVT